MRRSLLEALRGVALLSVSLSICLLLMEGGLRIFRPQPVVTPLDCYASDGLLGWKLKPDFRKSYSSVDFTMEVTTNDKGYRDVSHTYENPENRFRILGLGDSFLFGYGINNSENVLVRLEESFGGRGQSGIEVETINQGIPGYNVDNYNRSVQFEGRKYNPDLVLLFFYANDWIRHDQKYEQYNVSKEGFLLTGKEFSFKSLRSFLYPLRAFLKRRSQLYLLVRGRLRNVLKRKGLMQNAQIDIYRRDPHFADKYSHVLEVLKDINEFCAKDIGCSFAVCIIPENIQVRQSLLEVYIDAHDIENGDYDWSQPQTVLRDFCSSEGIFCLDLAPSFREAEQRGEVLYFPRVSPHWTKKGHALAAEEVFRFIIDNDNDLIGKVETESSSRQ